ncbi:protein of unknown function [Stenotrophomonas maltophilia]|nr:protein of unknown function [Stenotrophomonas maltophilia]
MRWPLVGPFTVAKAASSWCWWSLAPQHCVSGKKGVHLAPELHLPPRSNIGRTPNHSLTGVPVSGHMADQ